jgi:hypothetical protein
MRPRTISSRWACGIAMLAVAAIAWADGGVNALLGRSFPGQSPAIESASAPQRTVVYTAARIITMERGQPAANAVAVAGKRIVEAGSLDQVRKALGSTPFTMDETFRDKVILPGFIDQHLHRFWAR